MTSVRRRLLVSLISAFLISIAGAMTYVYFQTQHELKEIFENSMRETAELFGNANFTDGRPYPPAAAMKDPNEQLVLQIWDAGGNLLHSVPETAPIPLNRKLRDGASEANGRWWQTYTVREGNGGFIQISRPSAMAKDVVEENILRALLPFLALFFILCCGAWFLIGKNLAPLNALSAEIAGRRIGHIEPIIMDRVPAEIQPIIHALNDLLLRLDRALEAQRRFTADAAHELRTPLTALQLQIDVLKKAKSEQDKADAAKTLENGIDRAARLVHQMLAASRSAAPSAPDASMACNLSDIVRDILSGFSVAAEKENIKIASAIQGGVYVLADNERLHSMAANIIDNALKYTPAGGNVSVTLSKDALTAKLDVTDTGPGIPPEMREKVFERFYRLPGTGKTGSGLGLAIVKDIAAQTGARMEVSDNPGGKGVKFSVTLPAIN
ncbi:MAG: hypothetical protein HY370_08310 [Proteobacteria bacterium]|nr:hypothetical protein [Pseudomonadota bacterium]